MSLSWHLLSDPPTVSMNLSMASNENCKFSANRWSNFLHKRSVRFMRHNCKFNSIRLYLSWLGLATNFAFTKKSTYTRALRGRTSEKGNKNVTISCHRVMTRKGRWSTEAEPMGKRAVLVQVLPALLANPKGIKLRKCNLKSSECFTPEVVWLMTGHN